MPFGLLIVDTIGWVLTLNRAAATMVKAEDGLFLRYGRLTSARPDEARHLKAHIARAATSARHNRGGAAGKALRLSRPSGCAPYALLITPIAANDLDAAERPEPLALVLVTDPEGRPAPCGRYLAELFGLTPAEARLATALSGGASLVDYAGEASVALETARWRLKKIFVKTDTHRQSDLIALILSTPAGLGI